MLVSSNPTGARNEGAERSTTVAVDELALQIKVKAEAPAIMFVCKTNKNRINVKAKDEVTRSDQDVNVIQDMIDGNAKMDVGPVLFHRT
jgi:hypothetical protein